MLWLLRILIASLKAKETRHAFIGFAFIGAAAGTMVHSFFDFQLHVFPNALVFALLAAIAAGPLLGARRREQGVSVSHKEHKNPRKKKRGKREDLTANGLSAV